MLDNQNGGLYKMGDLQSVISRALQDPVFCTELSSYPEETLRENGVEPTPEMIDALNSLDADAIQKLAAIFTKQHPAAV